MSPCGCGNALSNPRVCKVARANDTIPSALYCRAILACGSCPTSLFGDLNGACIDPGETYVDEDTAEVKNEDDDALATCYECLRLRPLPFAVSTT